MREEIAKTLKSVDTEDWVDYHVVRPVSYYFAKLFAFLHWTPNAVTVTSMVVGALSCLFFAHGCYYYEGWAGLAYNMVGFLLLLLADVLDCSDGQLARMTGQKSRIGRILDGLAGFTWYIPIYAALVFRFWKHHDIEFGWLGLPETDTTIAVATMAVFFLALFSGFLGISPQQRIADYYIQAHLFFLKGEKGSELDNAVKQQEVYNAMDHTTPWYERLFQKQYVDYTLKQERRTPQLQRLLKLLQQHYGDASAIPQALREEYRTKSLPLLKWNGMLTFNFRTFYFIIFCLLDVPVLTFFFELIVMSVLASWVTRRYERVCRTMSDALEQKS